MRRAILDAAADLFSTLGLGEVTLRDIAARADVQVSLIARYVGSREELIDAVMADLAERVGRDLVDHPLEQQSFEPTSALGQWTRLLAGFAISGRRYDAGAPLNPSTALAEVIQAEFGLDETAARVRAAQAVAAALGWRLLEEYLIEAGDLGDLPVAALRDELTETVKRIGATPWPASPPGDAGHTQQQRTDR